MRSLVGHGIGRSMHEEPQIPNYGPPGKGIVLEEGMVLAVEPMVTAGRHMVRMGDDGWAIYSQDGSLAAHFEFTIAITADGPRILTPWHEGKAPRRRVSHGDRDRRAGADGQRLVRPGRARGRPWDYDADGQAEVAVGVPAENIGAVADAGMVEVVSGTSLAGTVAGHAFSANSPGVPGTSSADARLGTALAPGGCDAAGRRSGDRRARRRGGRRSAAPSS